MRVRVGLGVLVGTTRVLVGRGVRVGMNCVCVGRGVLVGLGVRVGRSVGVSVRLGMPVRRVFVGNKKGVRLGVIEAVTVMVEVSVGRLVRGGPKVGFVAVGNGPISALDVSAMAVIVFCARDCRAANPGVTREIAYSHTATSTTDRTIPSRTCGRSAYSFQRNFILATLRSGPGEHGRGISWNYGLDKRRDGDAPARM